MPKSSMPKGRCQKVDAKKQYAKKQCISYAKKQMPKSSMPKRDYAKKQYAKKDYAKKQNAKIQGSRFVALFKILSQVYLTFSITITPAAQSLSRSMAVLKYVRTVRQQIAKFICSYLYHVLTFHLIGLFIEHYRVRSYA